MLNIYVTYIESGGSLLKVWGQIEPTAPIIIEKALTDMIPEFELGNFMPAKEHLRLNDVICARFKDGLYYRAIITNISHLNENMLEVQFIDYGNVEYISFVHVRTLADHNPGLLTIPPQAQPFYLMGVTHSGHCWDANILMCINNEFRYCHLQYVQVTQVRSDRLIRLFRGNEDVASTLLHRRWVASISLQVQQMMIEEHHKRLTTPSVSPAYHLPPVMHHQQPPQTMRQPVAEPVRPVEPIVLVFKSLNVEPYVNHQVYVSYVLDGPCIFSVQLKSLEDKLARLMSEINSMPLRPLDEHPLPGKVCLARCAEDDHICRAVVTSEVDNKYKVFFVDFGNTEILNVDELFEIPPEKIVPKVMAVRYGLSGIERSTVTMEMKYAFKSFVSDKLLIMRAFPPASRSSLPTCELWDEKNVSVLDVIKHAALMAYPEPLVLNRGFNQEVRVSYVFSCKQFYVQLKSKETELQQLMADLQESCNATFQPLPVNLIKTGSPCCALFENDNQWYRAQILEVNELNIKVRYVDFGNESVVPLGNLQLLQSKHILALRPQAIECCLNGYQNMTPDSDRDNFLEEIILEKDFFMKVIEMIGTCVLVDLIDCNKYNVASLLLDRIAASTSHISPLLVQDGNKVDHRKKTSPLSPKDNNFRSERRPLRDHNTKTWDERSHGFERHSRSSISDSSEDNRPDFKNRNFRSQFGKTTQNNNRSDDTRFENQSDDRRDNRKDFGRFDNRKDFDRGDGRRNFERNDDKKDFDRFERRRDFDRGDGKKDFGRNENRKDFSRNDNREFGKKDGSRNFAKNDGTRDFQRNDSNRDFSRNNGARDFPRNKEYGEKSWSNDGIKRNHKNNFQKEGSEKSWSDGSDRSFKKSARQNISPKQRFNKDTFDKKPFNKSPSYTNKTPQVDYEESFDLASSDATYKTLELVEQTKTVSISWFHNPSYFYCQLNENQDEFRKMMEEIQKTYPKRKPGDVKTGAPVVSLFPEDGVYYRGRVLQAQFLQYRVQYVDFGNFCTVDKVWPIDNKFMELPAQAFCCGLALNPPEGKWPQPDTYCSYLDKEDFTCTFISKSDNKYIVDLINNGTNVSESLIAAGLAAKVDDTPPIVIDINILANQQLRAIVIEVKSLDDFTIEIQKNCHVSCCIYNLATATNIFENKLKELVGCRVIAYVAEVANDRAYVTLYDLNGNIISLVEPDEGALQTIWTLCALPVYQPVICGYVSWVTPSSVFIQPAGFEDTIGQLLEQLYQYYSTNELQNNVEPAEGNIYAVLSSDTNWYRGSVTAVDGDNITVMFLDYGNTETVSVKELRELIPEFSELHALAIEIYLKEDTSKYQEQEITVKLSNVEGSWEGEVEQVVEQLEQQVEEEIVEVQAECNVQEVVEVDEEKGVTLPDENVVSTQSGIAVVISHVDSPSEFYVQLSSALATIDSLQATIQTEINNFPELDNSSAGVLCAAPYSVDSQWYRAQVLDADNDITTVRFVDFGNTDVLDNTSTHIKTLPSEFLALEQHARRCSLNIKPKEEEWSLAACQKFEALAFEDENLLAEIIHQDEKTTYIDLFVNNKNIADVLVKEGLAEKLELEVENNLTGFVSHLNSPSEFWIQLESSVADLEWIADQLSVAHTFPELEDLTPGSLSAAIFSEDEQWYRARILSNTVGGIEVLFIDYGNSCTCTSLRELPEDLIMLPALAQKCTLKKPSEVEQWTPQAVEKFKEISADGVTIFKIHKITTGETAEVELFLNGEDISLQLMPQTVDGVVTKFESFDSLWVLKRDDKDPVECKLEDLPGFTWTEAAAEKFSDMILKGTTVFQVETLNDNTIRLYIEGRDIRYDLDSTKISSGTGSSVASPKRYITNYMSETVQEIVDNAISDNSGSESVCAIAGDSESSNLKNPNTESIENETLSQEVSDVECLGTRTENAESETKTVDEKDVGNEVENKILPQEVCDVECLDTQTENAESENKNVAEKDDVGNECESEEKSSENEVNGDIGNAHSINEEIAEKKLHICEDVNFNSVKTDDVDKALRDKTEKVTSVPEVIMDKIEGELEIKAKEGSAEFEVHLEPQSTTTYTTFSHLHSAVGSEQKQSTPCKPNRDNCLIERSTSSKHNRSSFDDKIVPGAVSYPYASFHSDSSEDIIILAVEEIEPDCEGVSDAFLTARESHSCKDSEEFCSPIECTSSESQFSGPGFNGNCAEIEEMSASFTRYLKISNDERILSICVASSKVDEEISEDLLKVSAANDVISVFISDEEGNENLLVDSASNYAEAQEMEGVVKSAFDETLIGENILDLPDENVCGSEIEFIERVYSPDYISEAFIELQVNENVKDNDNGAQIERKYRKMTHDEKIVPGAISKTDIFKYNEEI